MEKCLFLYLSELTEREILWYILCISFILLHTYTICGGAKIEYTWVYFWNNFWTAVRIGLKWRRGDIVRQAAYFEPKNASWASRERCDISINKILKKKYPMKKKLTLSVKRSRIPSNTILKDPLSFEPLGRCLLLRTQKIILKFWL